MSTIRAAAADWRRLALPGSLLLIALVVPPLAGLHEAINPDNASARFDIYLGTQALVLALYAMSYNLMLGYAGLVSFAHAAFYGIGAYTVSILFARLHMNPLIGLALAPFVGGTFGLLTGIVALRAVLLYFSLLTLAISQLLFVIAFQWEPLTGGDSGLHGLDLPTFLSSPTSLYYFIALVVVLALVLMFTIVRSPFGAALKAIRENRLRAGFVGINVKAYELAVFTLAAAFGGLAGALYDLYQPDVQPQLLYWTQNSVPVVIALLGGIGSFLGPVVGAFVYVFLNNWITTNVDPLVQNLTRQKSASIFDITLGVIVLLIVLIIPGGLVTIQDSLAGLVARLRGRQPRPEPEAEVVGPEARATVMSAESAAHLVTAAVGEESAHAPVGGGELILRVQGVSKAFGGLRAVNRVDLDVRRGDRHAIIGPNGAGKSTLFNLITGRIRPDSGRIIFGGRDITGRPAHEISRAGLGRAFQITNIFPKITVQQNVQYAMLAHRGLTRRPFGVADRMFRDEAHALLEAVGLARFAATPAGQLSHGDQRALEMAISMALGSNLLLLDEPTAGMSPYETARTMELVRQVTEERGLTLLFCEHDMSVVFGTARTVTVMVQGMVLVEGTPEQIRNNPEVQRVYLGDVELIGA